MLESRNFQLNFTRQVLSTRIRLKFLMHSFIRLFVHLWLDNNECCLPLSRSVRSYNIPQAKDEEKMLSYFFAFHVRCSFSFVICDLNFSKDHGKFALEINTLSCGYQIWWFFCFTFYSLCSFDTSGNLFSWFVQKDYKRRNEHTHTLSVRPFSILCMWKMWRKKRKSFPYNPIIHSDLMKHNIVCCCRRSGLRQVKNGVLSTY